MDIGLFPWGSKNARLHYF